MWWWWWRCSGVEGNQQCVMRRADFLRVIFFNDAAAAPGWQPVPCGDICWLEIQLTWRSKFALTSFFPVASCLRRRREMAALQPPAVSQCIAICNVTFRGKPPYLTLRRSHTHTYVIIRLCCAIKSVFVSSKSFGISTTTLLPPRGFNWIAYLWSLISGLQKRHVTPFMVCKWLTGWNSYFKRGHGCSCLTVGPFWSCNSPVMVFWGPPLPYAYYPLRPPSSLAVAFLSNSLNICVGGKSSPCFKLFQKFLTLQKRI